MSSHDPAAGSDLRAGPRQRVLGLAAAVLAAALAALAAPDGWPDGAGRVTVSYRGTTVADAEVEIGPADPVAVEGRAGDATVRVVFEEGIGTDRPIRAETVVERGGEPVRPAIGDVAVTVGLPDGRRAPVPVLSWDAAAQVLVAGRHPPVQAATALALLAGAVVLWVTAAVPLYVTALTIPVVLTAGGVTGAATALAPFFDPIIVLFFAGFLLAEAMRRVALDRWAAGRVVALAGRGPAVLFVAMMTTAAFLSMWMSNTAAVAVLIPIALAVTAPLGDREYTRTVVLGTAYAATVGGVGSAIGTPANLLAIDFLDTFEIRDISFAGWFAFGLPMVVLMLPVIGLYLWWRARPSVDPARLLDLRNAARAQSEHTTFGRRQARVLGVFLLVVAGWLTQTWHGTHPGVVALAGMALLSLVGEIREEDLGRINWTALLTFGGGLTLGIALTDTGVADWVAGRLGGLDGLPDPIAVAVVAVVTLALTTVASNTASAATLIPLSIPLAGLLGVDATLLVVVVAIASSIDFALIIGTPPTMMAYSTGLFRPVDILRRGALLDVAGLAVLLTAVVAVWEALGVV